MFFFFLLLFFFLTLVRRGGSFQHEVLVCRNQVILKRRRGPFASVSRRITAFGSADQQASRIWPPVYLVEFFSPGGLGLSLVYPNSYRGEQPRLGMHGHRVARQDGCVPVLYCVVSSTVADDARD